MYWNCYVFKKNKYTYLVAEDDENSAWIALAKRQSCSIKNCKKWYSYNGFMTHDGGVWKIKNY